VAAKKDMINDYTSVVSEAGLTPVVVDVDAFAVQNSFEVNYECPRTRPSCWSTPARASATSTCWRTG